MNKTPVDIDQEAILLFHDLAKQRDNYALNDEKAGFTVSPEFRHRFFSLLDVLNLVLSMTGITFSVIFSFQADRELAVPAWTSPHGGHIQKRPLYPLF